MQGDTKKYFKTIGDLYNAIEKNSNFDEAQKEVVGYIHEYLNCSFTILWQQEQSLDSKDCSTYSPYFWFGDADFTNCRISNNETLNKCIADDNSIFVEDSNNEDNPNLNFISSLDAQVSSAMIVPFSPLNFSGFLQLVKTGGEKFTSDEYDLVDICISMIVIKFNTDDSFDFV